MINQNERSAVNDLINSTLESQHNTQNNTVCSSALKTTSPGAEVTMNIQANNTYLTNGNDVDEKNAVPEVKSDEEIDFD